MTKDKFMSSLSKVLLAANATAQRFPNDKKLDAAINLVWYWKDTQEGNAAAALGRMGGRKSSARKAAAVRKNGKKGGRPKKITSSTK